LVVAAHGEAERRRVEIAGTHWEAGMVLKGTNWEVAKLHGVERR
jgi:hypothetical protein